MTPAAIEANSLLSNEVLMGLLATISSDAKTALVSLDAADTGAIRDQQALCRAVDEITTRLKLMAQPEREHPSVA